MGRFSWIDHILQKEFEEKVFKIGLNGIKKEITKSWRNAFLFNSQEVNIKGEILSPGLRPAQIGALHAIGAHWSLSNAPATVVMPTGTGKTEAMVSTLIAFMPEMMLVTVPWKALRDQTANKFLSLGLLRQLENIPAKLPNPIVGIIEHRPKAVSDLEIFDQCNVVISHMGTVAQGTAINFIKEIAEKTDCLIIDEAHHIGADTWSNFRNHFQNKTILQFTATPFRRDSKLIDGKVIFNYPLSQAFSDGYFAPIDFKWLFELDEDQGDEVIAKKAIDELESNLSSGLDHLLMARCEDIERAKGSL